MNTIKGPYAVLMTPFSGDVVDGEAFISQIKRLNDKRVSGYVVNGSTSEFIQLSPKEQKCMVELTALTKAKGKQMIVSACTGNVSDTYEICCHAADMCADAVLICPPYYFEYTVKEREAYFRKIADISPVPVILYNIPFFTQELELSVIYRLFEHKNIVGIKDSSANMKRLMHLVEYTAGSEKSVMTGTDDILLPALVGGCAGSMTAFATIFPDEVGDIYSAVAAGDYARAKEVQMKLLPLLRKADSKTFPQGYKRLMEEVSGIPFGDKEVVV